MPTKLDDAMSLLQEVAGMNVMTKDCDGVTVCFFCDGPFDRWKGEFQHLKDCLHCRVVEAVRTVPVHGQGEADASLIAAAPDMLAVLKRIERDLTALKALGEPLKSVRAAIAKARGQS